MCKELHALIRALTLGQHLGVRQQLPAKRLRLYDVYYSMEVHDPEAIRSAFPTDSRHNLSSTKRVLLDQITRYIYLHTLHDGIRDLELLIGEAKALMVVGQNSLALEKTDKAVRDAIKLEAQDELLKAVRLRHKVMEALRIPFVDKLDLLALEQKALAGMAERQAIDALYSQASALRKLPVTTQYYTIESLAQALSAVPFPIHVRNQIQYRMIRFYVSRVKLESDISLHEASEIVRTIDIHPGLMGDLDIREEYFNKMNFLITELSDRRAFFEAEERLNKLKALSVKWSGGVDGNPTQYARYLFAVVSLKMGQNKWDVVHALVKQINKEIVEQDVLKGVALRPSILRIGALAAFLIGDFRLARRFILNIKLSMGEYATKSNLVTWAGVMYLLSYVEERDPFLRTALKDVAAWFKQAGCTSDFEKIMLEFFKEISEDADLNVSPSSLDRLDEKLTTLFRDPAFGLYSEILKIKEWIESRQRGIEFRTLVF